MSYSTSAKAGAVAYTFVYQSVGANPRREKWRGPLCAAKVMADSIIRHRLHDKVEIYEGSVLVSEHVRNLDGMRADDAEAAPDQ